MTAATTATNLIVHGSHAVHERPKLSFVADTRQIIGHDTFANGQLGGSPFLLSTAAQQRVTCYHRFLTPRPDGASVRVVY